MPFSNSTDYMNCSFTELDCLSIQLIFLLLENILPHLVVLVHHSHDCKEWDGRVMFCWKCFSLGEAGSWWPQSVKLHFLPKRIKNELRRRKMVKNSGCEQQPRCQLWGQFEFAEKNVMSFLRSEILCQVPAKLFQPHPCQWRLIFHSQVTKRKSQQLVILIFSQSWNAAKNVTSCCNTKQWHHDITFSGLPTVHFQLFWSVFHQSSCHAVRFFSILQPLCSWKSEHWKCFWQKNGWSQGSCGWMSMAQFGFNPNWVFWLWKREWNHQTVAVFMHPVSAAQFCCVTQFHMGWVVTPLLTCKKADPCSNWKQVVPFVCQLGPVVLQRTLVVQMWLSVLNTACLQKSNAVMSCQLNLHSPIEQNKRCV